MPWKIELNSTQPTFTFKVYNRNGRKRWEICLKLTIKTPDCHWRRSGIFIVNFEYMLQLFLLTLNRLIFARQLPPTLFRLYYRLYHKRTYSLNAVTSSNHDFLRKAEKMLSYLSIPMNLEANSSVLWRHHYVYNMELWCIKSILSMVTNPRSNLRQLRGNS